MIKKTLFILIVISLSLIMLWGFWGWFVTKESEQQLRMFLQDNFNKVATNNISAELSSYKTNLIGADTSIKINSKVDFIQAKIDELSLKAKLLNGPVFYEDGNILFGKALWRISLDSSVLKRNPPDSEKNLPFLSVLIGFDNRLSYQSHLRKLSFPSLYIESIVTTGTIGQDALANRLAMTMNDISFLTEFGVVNIPELDIDININKQKFLLQKHISYTIKPFIITSKENETNNISLVSKGNFSYINNKLSGLFELHYADTSNTILSVEAYNLSVKAYQSFLQSEANILNLKQQVRWTLEEGAETPEGQDHLWKLYDQINNKRHSVSKIMTQKVFVDNNSRLKFFLALSQNKPFLPDVLWLILKKKLAQLSEKGLLNQVNSHYQIEIKSSHNKLLINDNPMKWEEVLNLNLR